MTPQRWQQVKELFLAALERDVAERAAYLTSRCADDHDLLREIESLLAQHERAQGFLSSPALGQIGIGESGEALDTGDALDASRLDSLVGQQIQHYAVERLLGKGGMGAVYMARDVRLGRHVALKLLSPRFALHEDGVRRFQREARAGSALNHPNIVTVHEIGQLDGLYFIVTELVNGQTLEARIDAQPLDCSELVNISLQVADALREAHEHGIIHRDIKSSNIMLTRRGQVKVLDLGLAKVRGDHDNARPVAWTGPDTQSGVIMGTVPFMSPEQSRGEEVDHRTDLFSFGVVMYQMACGRLPFVGASAFDTLEQIRSREPEPVSRLNPRLPAEVERIIRGCLAKQRDRRYQSARALWNDLHALGQDRTDGRAPRASAVRLRRWAWLGATAAALAITAAVLAVDAREASPRQIHTMAAARAAVRPARFTQLTHQAGEEMFPGLGPDGSSLVYASRAAGNWDIYYQRISGSNAFNLTADSAVDDREPALSPDGRWIAFRSERDGGGIFLMEATGASVRRVSATGANPAWSPDGKELVYATLQTQLPHSRRPGEVWAVNIASGEQRLVAAADATQPSWSPHGHRIAYWGLHQGTGRRDIWTIPATGGEPVAVTDDDFLDWNPVWSPDGGQLYFASDRSGSMNLWRVALDEVTGEVLGAPEPVTTPSSYAAHISFSRDGKRMAYAHVLTRSNLQRVAFDPDTETITSEPAWVTQGSIRVKSPDLSPDGQWLVFVATDEANREDLFVMHVDGAGRRRLTSDAHRNRTPRWSADGQRIAFYSDRSGKYEVWLIDPDGSDLRQVTHTTGRGVYYPVWSPDASRLLYQHRGVGNFIMDVNTPWAEQSPERLPQGDVEVFTPWSWSPDGQKLVGGLRLRGQQTRALATYSLATGEYEPLTTVGLEPAVWLEDSRRLLFDNQGTLYLVDSRSEQVRELLSIAPDEIGALTLSADDRAIYFDRISTEADIWLAELE